MLRRFLQLHLKIPTVGGDHLRDVSGMVSEIKICNKKWGFHLKKSTWGTFPKEKWVLRNCGYHAIANEVFKFQVFEFSSCVSRFSTHHHHICCWCSSLHNLPNHLLESHHYIQYFTIFSEKFSSVKSVEEVAIPPNKIILSTSIMREKMSIWKTFKEKELKGMPPGTCLPICTKIATVCYRKADQRKKPYLKGFAHVTILKVDEDLAEFFVILGLNLKQVKIDVKWCMWNIQVRRWLNF